MVLKLNAYNWFIHSHSGKFINQLSFWYAHTNSQSSLYLSFCLLFVKKKKSLSRWVTDNKPRNIRTGCWETHDWQKIEQRVAMSLTNLYLRSKSHLLIYSRLCCFDSRHLKKIYCFNNIRLSGNMGPN